MTKLMCWNRCKSPMFSLLTREKILQSLNTMINFLKKFDLSNEKIISAKSAIYSTFGTFLSSKFQCCEYYIVNKKHKKLLAEIVVLPGDKLNDIFILNKTDYFSKLKQTEADAESSLFYHLM